MGEYNYLAFVDSKGEIMVSKNSGFKQNPLRKAITDHYRMDETACINKLINLAQLPDPQVARIQDKATNLVTSVRGKRLSSGGLDAFMYQYDLSNQEGIALMCLAEALLRIPDPATADKLIKDKIVSGDWQAHVGKSESMFVNSATWGLMLTGKIYQNGDLNPKNLQSSLKNLAKRSGEPIVRKTASYAMKILGRQFVMGRTIEEGIKRARDLEKKGYRYSYDMLGEAARTSADALRYFQDYQNAIEKIAKVCKSDNPAENPGISVKLSALHPRYEFAKHASVLETLVPRLLELAKQAKQYNMGLTVDAEEADRLDLSLDVIESVFTNPELHGWEGFGLAVQSYQKRALPVLEWLVDLARRQQRKLMVRLIKGAYWDSEIKNSQELGLEGYPVFTQKYATDVSFQACAKYILQSTDAIYPQFASHNAYSVATILELVDPDLDFEFQCLHGMGQALYDEIVGADQLNIPCRIYAPIGSHEDLLAYLVRRLLENGANSSFVNRIVDAEAPIEELVADPVAIMRSKAVKTHPKISLPKNIYGRQRLNSKGIDLTNSTELEKLYQDIENYAKEEWLAEPMVPGYILASSHKQVYSPTNLNTPIGRVAYADPAAIQQALDNAEQAFTRWDHTLVLQRAACLEKMADLLEDNTNSLIALAVIEAGKTIPDAIAEVREAVDFCRYYAAIAKQQLISPEKFVGPTGEDNQMQLSGRGVILCISPWNFPLAIFLGQVVAALVTGNTVIAKPAEQTSLIAGFAVNLLHQADVPEDVIQLLPGGGEDVAAKCVADTRVAGVIFTGSTETARIINQTLANRPGAIVPLIAETGGQNAMIVDSSALPEQVINDVIKSAFGSAGQRCSALRVLYLQADIADKTVTMLQGAMQELQVGDPVLLATDVGPVIDSQALEVLNDHKAKMNSNAKLIYEVAMDQNNLSGTFCAPAAYEISAIDELSREVFGPILHVIRYQEAELDQVIDQINSTGYGLTLGIHSRIDDTVEYIQQRVRVGNTYVNRAMTGAVVGVQPFGGEGLSGTGPKAGGPHYLLRLCTERTISVDTTAAGGNASLMSL